MIHLKPGMDMGVWRDLVYGLGGGRIPFDDNVALAAAAALRNIASMAKYFNSEVFGNHAEDWAKQVDHYA
jgi:hypothetical protein